MSVNKEEKTEQAILAAAEAEFMEKGFDMSKTTEIAKRVGVNQALVHYYFRTKENLFNMVFSKKAKEMAGSFMTIVEDELPFLEKVRRGMESHFDFIAANPKLPFFMFREFFSNEKRIEVFKVVFLPIIAEVVAKLDAGIKAEAAKGLICEIDARMLVVDIVSLNVFVFVSRPVMESMAAMAGEDFATFLQRRKKENVEMIMRRLRKIE